MKRDLTELEQRLLGCLIEKERTTPDNYPLSTNALRSACNQKTSRDPVMDVSEKDVDATMLSLRERGLARSLRPSGSRAWKHRHVTTEVLPVSNEELALLAVLMLRGAQTPGELRSRTDRMAGFDDVDAVEKVLDDLESREEALVRNTGRGPGQSQDRWVHLLGELSEGGADLGAATTDDRPALLSERTPSIPTRPSLAPAFRELHNGFFIMPNPWDRGSAKILEDLGFKALATTSAGHGRSIGKDDQEVTRDELLRHVADLTAFVGVPLNVDSERLFPTDPGGLTETVRLLADAGASGCSVEDYNPATNAIDALHVATEAVAEAADVCGRHGIVLTARAENHLYGLGDLDDTIERLLAYEAGGADVLYAPGLTDPSDIQLVIESVSIPINVLLMPAGPSVSELAALGVNRVSIGSAFYNAAYKDLSDRAALLLDPGLNSGI